jgi:hypothetical protein
VLHNTGFCSGKVSGAVYINVTGIGYWFIKAIAMGFRFFCSESTLIVISTSSSLQTLKQVASRVKRRIFDSMFMITMYRYLARKRYRLYGATLLWITGLRVGRAYGTSGVYRLARFVMEP